MKIIIIYLGTLRHEKYAIIDRIISIVSLLSIYNCSLYLLIYKGTLHII